MRWNVPPLRIGSAVTHAAIVMVAPSLRNGHLIFLEYDFLEYAI
jgi:hypothetical protein